MSSQVQPNTINSQYPVPGVNQSSQGFRSNFLAIQNAFTQYVAEMNDVINKVIVSAPLLYGANITMNNFGGMQNSNLSLLDYALVSTNITATSSNSVPTLNFANLSVANINITAGSPTTQTINVANFPKLGYSEMVVKVNTVNTPQFLNFSAVVPGGSLQLLDNAGIAGFNSSTANFAVTTTGPYIFKLGSSDGLNFTISAPTSAVAKSATPPTSVGSIGDTTGMIAFDTSYAYICTGNYNGSTTIWRRAALSTF